MSSIVLWLCIKRSAERTDAIEHGILNILADNLNLNEQIA